MRNMNHGKLETMKQEMEHIVMSSAEEGLESEGLITFEENAGRK